MTGIEQFRYDGKRALVVGGATGMGAAAAKAAAALGAEVVVMDHAPVAFEVARSVSVDLSDRASIDSAIDQVGGPIDAIFSAAGVVASPAGQPAGQSDLEFVGACLAQVPLVERIVVFETIQLDQAPTQAESLLEHSARLASSSSSRSCCSASICVRKRAIRCSRWPTRSCNSARRDTSRPFDSPTLTSASSLRSSPLT